MKKIISLSLANLKTSLKNNKRFNEIIDQIIQRSKPLVDRWIRLTVREKQLVGGLLAIFGIFILSSIIGSAINLSSQLNNKYILLQAYKLDAQSIQKEFKELSNITANEFNSVSIERIKGDTTQALSVVNPDITLQDNILIIKADNVLFESVILLLEQLRKSYGIFPSKLKVTQSRSGYVNFSATFSVSQ